MPDPTLFHGIAVLIDDDVSKPESGIRTIQAQIEAAGCHVVQMRELPSDASVMNLRGMAFCVLDWNLYGNALREAAGGEEVPATPMLKKQNADAAIAFLKKLKKVCVAPVFIFTNEAPEEVEEALSEHPELSNKQDPSHILVRRKTEVITTGVFPALGEWMEKAPSVYVLKKWERVYEKAKNELFSDFYNNSVNWPIVLWKTYEADEIDGALELGNLIGRNLLSRMTPFHFELTSFIPAFDALDEKERGGPVVMKVLEGERFLQKESLQADSIGPGDVFKKSGSFYINIRPDCDCIAREGAVQDEVKIYLLKGSKLTENQLREKANWKHGRIAEADNETVVFGMVNGLTVAFQFKNMVVEKWQDWKNNRIGRLLPPYLTRLQQRYAAYLERPGLTRIPSTLLPLPEEKVCPTAAAGGCQPVVIQPKAEEAVAAAEIKAEAVVETPAEPKEGAVPEKVPAADAPPAQDPPTPAS